MQTPICETSVDGNGRELVEHGTALFPIAAYHDDMMYADVPWHWHNEFESVVVTEGTAIFAVDGERITLRTGDGCFINASVLHGAWNAARGTPCRLHSLVYHPRLIGGSAESIFWEKYLLPVIENRAFQMLALHTGKDDVPLRCIENAWYACAEEPAGFEFTARHELSKLLLSTSSLLPAKGGKISSKRLRDEERMKRMLSYIRAHLADTLTIQSIAAAASVSESECIRCFRAMTGTTPIRYAIQLRLQKAAELLTETDDKVAEIGAACGFQEMGYFARAFRSQYGATPSAYRKSKFEGYR